jgi:hypothetical protein
VKDLDPVAVARALLARFDIRHPREIAIDLIAYHSGGLVLPRATGAADARAVRRGARAILAISPEALGTPRGRFSIAHELGHLLLHADHDAIARIHGAPRTSGREFKVEREADLFASEVLVPTDLAAPTCERETPSLDAVGALARSFDVSLTVAAKKWARLARAGCAFVEARDGKCARVVRSAGFRGVAVERRALEEGTLALEMLRTGGAGGRRVHRERDQRWGSALSDGEVIEECVALREGGGPGPVLTWLWHG